MRARNLLWLGSGIALGVALAKALPRLRREFGPLVSEATARASEMAADLADVVATQIEQAKNQKSEYTSHTSDRAAS